MLFAGGFLANEWAPGSVSEMMGLGHHHFIDDACMHDQANAHMAGNMSGMQPGAHMNRTAERCGPSGDGGMMGAGARD